MVSGSRWLITSLTQQWYGNILIVTITTDIPVHMFLEHTATPIRTHLIAKEKRGYQFMRNPYFCFVASQPIEQTEPGDTIIHTFSWPGWTHCLTQWYYFWAEKDAVVTVTHWGIFHRHFTGPLTVTLEPRGQGSETSIPNPVDPTYHWNMCRLTDTVYIPPAIWPAYGWFIGNFVHARVYNGYVYYRDLYRMDSLPSGVGEIEKIDVFLYLGKLYVYGRARVSVWTHGTVYDGPVINIPAGGLFYRSQELSLNPSTLLPWTVNEVDEMQVGLSLAHKGTFGRAVCDRVMVVVTYRPVL